MDKGILIRSHAESQSRREFIRGSQSNVRCTARELLGPLLFLAYVNDISRNFVSTIGLFADDCVICRKNISKKDTEKLQKDLDRLGEWAVEYVMKINPSKSKAVRFTRVWVKDPLDYSSANTLKPEASSCKYLGIILRSDLSWADQVNYTVKKKRPGRHYISQ
jgi:hypothetical protein